MPNHWIWVYGDLTALQWVVENETMAFAEHATTRIRPMAAGDKAVLYLTGTASRDYSRLPGTATVLGAPQRADVPIELADRAFPWTCPVRIDLFHGLREGPPVTDLVEELELIRRPATWGAYFRPSPIRVSEADWQTMVDAVDRWEPDR